MKSNDEKIEELLDIVEKMIDTRFRYLKERDFENHRCASKIKKEEYTPLKEGLVKILKEGLDKR